ncbi:hypothetical protein O3P69_001480 [Scylla paramamosain]|uniref:Glucosylceramidase n=3 Tax=Scylla TaxID=6760 RepID=A0AAW0UY03_SCYPA
MWWKEGICLILYLFSQVTLMCHGLKGECQGRDYGHGSIVCVCDTSHCDTLPHITPPILPSAFIISTNKAGRRWEVTSDNFIDLFSDSTFSDVLSDGELEEEEEEEEEVVVVKVEHGEGYQKIIGFGGAFTDAAGLNILSLPPELQDTVLRAYYSPEGLEYTMGRVPVGGTDFSTHPYTYDDLPPGQTDPLLTKFALAKEDLKVKIPLIQKALAMSPVPIKLFGSAWGAPGWMKDSGKIAGKGKVLLKYYKTWAQYYVR